jgi:hypothetical protein
MNVGNIPNLNTSKRSSNSFLQELDSNIRIIREAAYGELSYSALSKPSRISFPKVIGSNLFFFDALEEEVGVEASDVESFFLFLVGVLVLQYQSKHVLGRFSPK